MKHKPMASMNVIPFIDIMLVLLVMVLTTATFIRQGIIPVDLPEAKAADKKSDNKEVAYVHKFDFSYSICTCYKVNGKNFLWI